MIWTYIIIAVLLLAAELVYFRIADKCDIIDKPNERSSHKSIVLRGGYHFPNINDCMEPHSLPLSNGRGEYNADSRVLAIYIRLADDSGCEFRR